MTIDISVPAGLSEPQWGALGEDVFRRTYSRTKADGSQESWADTCKRVVVGNCSFVDKRFIERGEPERLFDLLYNFKVLPGGRHLWATGVKGATHVANCWVSGWSDDFAEHFEFAFARLMEGGGVGSNYSDPFLRKYAPIPNNTKLHIVCDSEHPDYDALANMISHEYSSVWGGAYQVSDSREGWVDALGLLLRSFYKHPEGFEFPDGDLVFDVSHVRAAGAPLKRFGGTASGPAPLVEMLLRVCALMNVHKGDKPDSFLALDIDHEIARCVVAGNVRRSARMSMKHWKDEGIERFITMKQGGDTHWTTNISVVLDRHFWTAIRRKDPHATKILRLIAEGSLHNGEPGIFNITKANEREPNKIVTTNPCLAYETRLVTPKGLRCIGELVDDRGSFCVWDGERWVESTAFSTGEKEIVRLTLSNGQEFRMTNDHRLGLLDGSEVTAQDSLGCSLDFMRPKHAETIEHRIAELVGFIQGDGTYHKASKRWKYVNLGKNDGEVKALFESEDWLEGTSPSKPHSFVLRRAYAGIPGAALLPMPLKERRLTEVVMTAKVGYVRGFLRGLYSANGSVVGGRVVLKAACRDLISDVQELLASLGIRSYVTTNKAKEVEFSNGTYLCAESYDLNIAGYEDVSLFKNDIGFIQEYKNQKLLEQQRGKGRRLPVTVVSVDPDGIEEVFDFSMKETHWASVAGFRMHNCGEIPLTEWGACNLGSVNLRSFAHDRTAAFEAFRLITRFLLRATFADYLDPKACAIIERDRRIGVGFTGFADWLALEGIRFSAFSTSEKHREFLRQARKIVRNEAREYAFRLRIPEPVKVTTCAPTGSTSKLCGVSEGMQPLLFRYFKRRVNYSTRDKEQQKLIAKAEADGLHVEDSVYTPDTKVVSYPCRASILDDPDIDETLVEEASDISLEEYLDTQKAVQDMFVDNSISFTINVDQEKVSVEDLEKALASFGPHLKGTTVMPFVSNRPQMPYESMTQEDFEQSKNKFSSAGEWACKNNSCHLVTKTEEGSDVLV